MKTFLKLWKIAIFLFIMFGFMTFFAAIAAIPFSTSIADKIQLVAMSLEGVGLFLWIVYGARLFWRDEI